jgi:hypothetical protein
MDFTFPKECQLLRRRSASLPRMEEVNHNGKESKNRVQSLGHSNRGGGAL